MWKNRGIRGIILTLTITGILILLAGLAIAGGEYTFVTKWDGSGTGSGFAGPLGLAVDSLGNVYAGSGADAYNVIRKYTANGTFITKWGKYLTPISISVDGVDNIYVFGAVVTVFTSDGVLLYQWSPVGYVGDAMTVDSSGNVYIADITKPRIAKFTSTGTFITEWGSQGSGDGQFYIPVAIATDSSGNVYVADRENDRIEKFTSDGEFITGWGSSGSGDGQFLGVVGIATDKLGNVYVTESNSYRIQKFTADGVFLTSWQAQDTGFYGLRFIAVDSSGNVYVTENGGYYIQEFAPTRPISNCIATLSSDLVLRVPIAIYDGQAYSAIFQLDGGTGALLTSATLLSNTSAFSNCTPATATSDLDIHIPVIIYNGGSYWGDLQYSGGSAFTIVGAGQNLEQE